MTPQTSPRLQKALLQSQAYGFLGPGPLDTPVAHAIAFLDVVLEEVTRLGGDASSASWLDLGSGGGLPGLVGIDRLPNTSWVLLDAQGKRVRFLESVVDEWQVADRTICVLGRAEEIYRSGQFDEVDIVVARGFGQPATTAECATGYLPVGGLLVVSEPPDSDGRRWRGVDEVGLGLEFSGVHRSGGFGFAVLRKVGGHAKQFPRSGAMLARQPLFFA
jgi:16S rRNA (guanine527-N7)-methyltransferase